MVLNEICIWVTRATEGFGEGGFLFMELAIVRSGTGVI